MYGIKSVRTSFKSIQILTFVLSSFQMSFGAALSGPIEVGCRSTKGSNDLRKGFLAVEMKSLAVEERILAGEIRFKLPKAGIG